MQHVTKVLLEQPLYQKLSTAKTQARTKKRGKSIQNGQMEISQKEQEVSIKVPFLVPKLAVGKGDQCGFNSSQPSSIDIGCNSQDKVNDHK